MPRDARRNRILQDNHQLRSSCPNEYIQVIFHQCVNIDMDFTANVYIPRILYNNTILQNLQKFKFILSKTAIFVDYDGYLC